MVGLSGGVDSAVAALLLQRQGYEVHAVFMKNWSADDFGGPCPWAEDQRSAQAVADHLRLPLETWNFERQYRDRVFRVMLRDYASGRTPNPDIVCNREIKFSLFLDRAIRQANFVATGHYAQTRDGRLFKAVDRDKDQSYFLAAVPAQALRHVIFPLAQMKKMKVRQLAKEAGLPNWDRPDSTGICFIGEKRMFDFLSRHLSASPGPIKLWGGGVVGQHLGLPFYTIGQRHGYGVQLDHRLLARTIGPSQPVFVAAKETKTNTLFVVPAESPALEARELLIDFPHWIHQPALPWRGMAKFRYRQPDTPVTLRPAGEKIRVVCQTPQRAITPGQYAVFYGGVECLGSAVIDSTEQ